MRIRLDAALVALGLLACQPHKTRVPADATLLYDVDFGAPEQALGKPLVVVPTGQEQQFPSRTPSQVFFGNPTVVAKLCGLGDQPLQLAVAHGQQGIEGVEFLLDQKQKHYHVELDLCIATLGPAPIPAQKMQLAVFLDIAEAYAVAFLASGEIGIVDPILAPETALDPRRIPVHWEANKPLRLGIDVDLDTQRWQVAVDGKQVFEGALRMTIPRAVRVVLRGNTSNEIAFDNLVIWGQKPIAADVPAPVTGEDQ